MLGQALIWGGALVTLGGIGGLIHCARLSMRAKTLDEDGARALMSWVITLNVITMGVAMLGLMTLVLGLILR